MKQILVDLDDRCARDLERVAPAKQRKRAEFIRRSIRQALDAALERETEAAYRAVPLAAATSPTDLEGWDPNNALATPAVRKSRRRSRAGASR